MSFTNNKNIGNTALGIAISYFTSQDYCVSIPLNDTQDYDLIVDMNNKLNKIQVRGTTQKSKLGHPLVHINSIGGRTGTMYKTITDTDIDYLFAVTCDLEQFLIPISDIKSKYALSLGPSNKKYKVN